MKTINLIIEHIIWYYDFNELDFIECYDCCQSNHIMFKKMLHVPVII